MRLVSSLTIFLACCCLLAALQPGTALRRLQQAAADGGSIGGAGAKALSPSAVEVAPLPETAPASEPAAGAPTAELAAGAPTTEASSCQAALNYSSVFMPPTAQFRFRLFFSGTRNYTCQTFTLQFGPAMALSHTLPGSAYNCSNFFVNPFVGIVDCWDWATGQFVGRITTDTTVPGSVFVLPAPDSATTEPWGRFKTATAGALPPANYVVRHNSTGGRRPDQCTAPRGEWVLVPFTTVADYYWCD